MNNSKTYFAVVSEIDNTLCSVWKNESFAQHDVSHSKEIYNADRLVVSGTIDELLEAVNCDREELENAIERLHEQV